MNRSDVVPEVLWTPSPQRVARAAMTDFTSFVADRTGRELPGLPRAVGVLDAGPGRLLVRDRRLLRACAGTTNPARCCRRRSCREPTGSPVAR